MTPPIPGPGEGLNAAVAAEIRAELARQRLSVQRLAEMSDVAYGTLRRYLAAERHIDVATLDAIASALGASPIALVQAAMARRQESNVVTPDFTQKGRAAAELSERPGYLVASEEAPAPADESDET